MLRNRFGRRSTADQNDKPFLCTIRFLDDSEPLSFTYLKETRGQEMFDQVCQSLDLLEKDCFGLRFVDSEKQRHWLDLLKPIYRQLKHVHPPTLCFRVKFYPSDPSKLREEITRYFLFLQLRRDLHHGRLLCSQLDANLLAAFIIQSEVGDYDPEDHLVDYVSKFKMLPKQTQRQEEKIMELHKSLVGQSPAESESNFLQKASLLDTYGVDPHPVKDPNGSQIYLGVTHLGIVTFQGSKRTRIFAWSQITKITYEGKMFIVHVTITEDEANFILIQRKKHLVGYKCPTLAACKHLWKCAVEQRYFFTLQSSKDVPRVTSGGGIFSRSSRFRFSGRCEKEAYSDDSVERDEPPRFVRTSSNPHFAQRYSSLRSGSVPTTFNILGLSEDSLDSLEFDRSHWRSLDDFSRRSPPRRPMDLTDHMIPEEPSLDMTDPRRSPLKNDPFRFSQRDEENLIDRKNGLREDVNGTQLLNGDVMTSNIDLLSSKSMIRRRQFVVDDGVHDNNLINAQLQELQMSSVDVDGGLKSTSTDASMRNGGRTGVVSTSQQMTEKSQPPLQQPAPVLSSSPRYQILFWAFIFTFLFLGIIAIIAVVRMPGIIFSSRIKELPDVQELIDPDNIRSD